MRKLFSFAAAAAIALAAPAWSAPEPIATAVANTSARSPDNIKLDESRKPAQVLKFLGLRPGMRVSDPFGGNLYWAEITAPIVGPKGRVSIWQPTQFYRQKTLDNFTAFNAKQPNVYMDASDPPAVVQPGGNEPAPSSGFPDENADS